MKLLIIHYESFKTASGKNKRAGREQTCFSAPQCGSKEAFGKSIQNCSKFKDFC